MDTLQNITNVLPLGGLGLASNYLNEDKKEPFEIETNATYITTGAAIINIVNLFVFAFALYIAFKCGGNFLEILAACCCSICYLVYRLAIPCNKL